MQREQGRLDYPVPDDVREQLLKNPMDVLRTFQRPRYNYGAKRNMSDANMKMTDTRCVNGRVGSVVWLV